MMKKILAFLLLPALVFGVVALTDIVAKDDVDYDVALGNQLSTITFDSNTYIEDPDKDELNYNYTIPSSFRKMAEDEELELYLEDETLAIAVRVKENGYVYASYNFNDTTLESKSAAVKNPIKAGVSLDLYKESTPTSTTYLDINPVAAGPDQPAAESSIYPLANGFRAAIDFSHPELMIRFDLIVTISDGKLHVNIPADSIVEYNPNLWVPGEQYYILRNIVVFPYFGSTKSETDGYVFIPDGSGALITLDSTPLEKASFSLNVYGSDLGYMSPSFANRALSTKDPSRVTMPIYGIFHNVGNTGFYAVAEEGANYAILNYKSTGVINDYYYTYFSFRYRQSYEQYQSRTNEDQYRISFQDDPNVYDVTVSYTFLSGGEADYVGMAKHYQQDLIDEAVLSTSKRVDYEETPTKIDFIGTEIMEGIVNLKIQDVTEYSEIIDTIETLNSDGYNDILVSLKTFSKDLWGYRFDVFRQLGGRSDFRDLIEYMDTNEINFSYYLDYVRSYDDFSNRHAQTLSKREIYHVELSRMYFAHLVNDTSYYMGFAEDDVAVLTKYGISDVAFNGFDRAIYTSWDNGILYSTRNMEEIQAMLEYYQASGFSTGFYNPDAYLYAYVSTYYDAPLSSSDFQVVSASVPFVQLVLGGYVDMYTPYLNFASDETYTLLRMVEYGVFPSYVLTGGSTYDLKHTNSSNIYISEYSVLQKRIDQYYQFVNEGLTATIQNEMVDHSFIGEGVIRVEYADGTQILLNYNEVAVTVDTTTVPALGYVVIGG